MMEGPQIAIYMRVSKEDGDYADESSSISNQRIILKNYVAEHFEEYILQEFSDDGFSGLNFNRPGITRLLELVKCGKIDCIIVKDFSRFSRDYIELGDYLDKIFPSLGVRFISVNDRYDSKELPGNVSDLEVSFRGLMYNLYSKDLSVKVRAALKVRKEQGQYVSSTSPFGYQKAPYDRHMLLIAEDEAEVVRDIFQMTAAGKTSAEIAECLNAGNIKTPAEFRIEKGEVRRTPKNGKFAWTRSSVCAILRNPVYVGDIQYNKYTRREVGGKNYLRPRYEWRTHHNHHEPIIEREVFEMVQEIRAQRKRDK